MSLKWDDIDSRQLKVKQQAKELKDFLIQQNEEVKKRKKQEKIDEREAYRKIVLGVNDSPPLKPIKTLPASVPAVPATITNSLIPLPTIAGIEPLTTLPLISTDPYPRIMPEEISTKLQFSENQILQERRARAVVENELQSGKYLIATLSAKVDSLQESIRNENANRLEITKHFSQRDQEAREALARLTQKLEMESQKVQRLVSELAASKQRESIVGTEQDGQIKALNDKINILTSKLETYAQKTNEVGNSLNFQSRELSMEARKQSDSLKSIKMHENALNALSEAVGTTSEALSKKMQVAANELFQKIEQEARARRLLEESIHHDTQEYRRMIERQFVDRVDSLQHATSSQIDSDRQEFEKIANALQTKLLRLESTTFDGQEQLAQLISQRLQLLDTQLQDLEHSNKKLETRMVTFVSELSHQFEAGLIQSEEKNEKRYKDVNKNVVAVQKIVHESILLSEKTLLDKIKSLEDVLRAEIKSRMDTDSKLGELSSLCEAKFSGIQTQIESIQAGMEEHKQENAKILNLIKSTALQLSKSQDRWTSTLETEISGVKNQVSKNKVILENQMNGTRQELLENLHQIAKVNQEENLKTFKGLETLVQSNSDQVISLTQDLSTLKEDTQKAANVQLAHLDATFEALKVDLAGKCTINEFQEKSGELNAAVNDVKNQAKQDLDKLEERIGKFVSAEDLEDTKLLLSNLTVRVDSSEKLISDTKLSLSTQLEKNKLEISQVSQEFEKKAFTRINELVEKIDSTNMRLSELDQNILENESKKNVLLVEVASTEKQLQKDVKKIEQEVAQCSAQNAELLEKIAEQHRTISKSRNELEAYIIDENVKNKDAVTQCQKHINSVGETTKRLTELLNETNTKLSKSLIDMAAVSREYADEVVGAKEKEILEIIDSTKKEQEKITATVEANSKAILILNNQTETENKGMETINAELDGLRNKVEEHDLWMEQVKFIANSNNSVQDLDTKVKKITMQIESNSSEVDRLRKTVHSQEQLLESKLAESANQMTIVNLELQTKSKMFNDLQSQLKDKIDNRQKECHKSNEQIAAEIKNLKNELSKVMVENAKLQTEMAGVKEETDAKVNHQNIENLISPISVKLDKLTRQMDHIDSEIQESKPRSAKLVPGSFYKPTHLKIEPSETLPESTPESSRREQIKSSGSEKVDQDEPFPLQHTPSNLEF
ncbi:hypothetical protein HK103_005937 [Boothiomyces macroporosus]|uniref:Uncharacterized protein n=1 Tax=Boothiomyces macroporosus TaxID=261099 RepID=A0AAD5YAR5_9FUNG|nr:hypothetical protein HK103_005937 [Boothiomyces macroporosus]